MKKENIPNLLTILRICMIPVFLILTGVSDSLLWHVIAAIVFAVASFTDYLDGYLARKWHVVTNFGKFADPLADKMLVMSAFIMLVGLDMVPAWVAAVIICRELAVTGLRLLLVENGGTVLAAAYARKDKNSDTDVICYPLAVSSVFTWHDFTLHCALFHPVFRL